MLSRFLYERPRLIRFSDIIGWANGQYDDPFAKCSGGSNVETSPDCFPGSGATSACSSGPSPQVSGCVEGDGNRPVASEHCRDGFAAGPGKCRTGGHPTPFSCQAGGGD
jgi:hypothetical protein